MNKKFVYQVGNNKKVITDYLIYANTGIPNLDSAILMKFVPKNSSHSTLHIGYKEKYIKYTVNTKFLGSQIDNHID